MKEQLEPHSVVKVFCVYAREDEPLRDELAKHLNQLRREKGIGEWHNRLIPPSTAWGQAVDQAITTAQIILFLISSDFLASSYCYDVEMQIALDRSQHGEALVIPIILRPCGWRTAPFGQLQCLPRDGKAVTTWRNRDEALADIVEDVRRALDERQSWTPTPPASTSLLTIFLSYSRRDAALGTRLQSDLQAQGIQVRTDQEDIQPGTPNREEAVRQAIRKADALVLIASPSSRQPRSVQDELRIAAMYQRPVYPVWAEGKDGLEAIPIDWGSRQYIDARAETYQRGVQVLVAALHAPSLSLDTSSGIVESASQAEPPRNPYKGLRPFTADDVGDFFGRQQFCQEMLGVLQAWLGPSTPQAQRARLLAIVGPSGSGKSSVMLAGLLPRLRADGLPKSENWIYLDPMVPGIHPLERLAHTLKDHLPQWSLTSIQEKLEDESTWGLHLLAEQLVQHSGKMVVLVIDQCEELFTQTADAAERQTFIDLLLTAVTEPRGSLLVLLTLRADFYDRLTLYPPLARLIETHHRLLLPMEVDDLRAAIEGPAALPDVQLTLEGTLAGDLLFEIWGQAGALPLLQFTLEHLFERRSGHLLTLAAYRDLGGVRGALARQAEATYAALPSDEHRHLARALFLRLIDPGATEQDTTRRRAALTELMPTDGKVAGHMLQVREAFVTARLLVTNKVAGTETIEISHEALIWEWPRLTIWLHEAREYLPLQKELCENAFAWKQRGKPLDRLYRGTQLREALAWRTHNLLSQDEEAFLHASLIEQRQQRYRAGRRRVLIGLAGISLAVATPVGGYLLFSKMLLAQRDSMPLPPSIYANHTNTVCSVAWSPDSSRIASGSFDTTVQIWDPYTGEHLFSYTKHTNIVWNVAWSPDGSRIASASADKTAQVWDAHSGKHLFSYTGHTSYAVTGVAWSPDSSRIASASEDKTVQIWDSRTGKRLFSCIGHTDTVTSVAWSPDGSRIASASADKTAQVWDASTGKHLFSYTKHTNTVTGVAWSPDGARIASSSYDFAVQVWDSHSGKPILSCPHAYSTASLSWSPDGSHIVFGGYDRTAQVWDSHSGKHLFSYTGHTNTVRSVAWSPDGFRIASGSVDKTAQVWDAPLRNGYLIALCIGHKKPVHSIAWSPENSRIASGSDDLSTRIWDAYLGKQLFTHPGHNGSINSVSWSPDSSRIASASNDPTVQIWDAHSGKRLLSYTNHTSAVAIVAWSPDGSRIASTDDTVVQVWDAHTGKYLLSYTSHADSIWSIAWSSDGTRIASGCDNGTQVWDAHTGKRLLSYSYNGSVLSATWSPDGSSIASGGNDNTVQVWDAHTGKYLLSYTGHTNSINSVAWASDGSRIASGSDDTTIQVWDAHSGQHLLSYTGHTNSVLSVAWSPDSSHIASGSADDTVQVWDAHDGERLFSYTGHTDSVNSVAWTPDGSRIASGSFDTTIQVWDTHTGKRFLSYTGAAASYITSVAWSPDGTRIASGSADQTVQVWSADAHTNQHLLSYRGHTTTVTCVAWSPDSSRIASGSADQTVQVWDAHSSKLLLYYIGHHDSITSVAWAPNGSRIASSDDKNVQIWDAHSGQHLLSYTGHTNSVLSIAWSPDSSHIASGSADDTVQVWDAHDGERLFSYTGHTDTVRSVSWAPDSLRIVSAGDDTSVQVWDARNGEHLFSYTGHSSPVLSATWASDNIHIASAGADNRVQVWLMLPNKI